MYSILSYFTAISIFCFSCNYAFDVMKRRVLIGSRMRGEQSGHGRQITQEKGPNKLGNY